MAERRPDIRINVMNMPELIFQLRQEMADFLRAEAGATAIPEQAKRLRELAAAYDVGAIGAQGRNLSRGN